VHGLKQFFKAVELFLAFLPLDVFLGGMTYMSIFSKLFLWCGSPAAEPTK
jgi:hypothetical protein